MVEPWWTSDDHFGHSNIIKYSKRPFYNVHEMDEKLISNWNEVVKPGHIVYHLGDIFFKMRPDAARVLRKRLNGEIHFIKGNHDKTAENVKDVFASFKNLDEIVVDGQRIVLCHYAMRTWNQAHRGAWMLYGHSHGSLPNDPKLLSFDVGVDCWNYYPISFEQVRAEMIQRVLAGASPTRHHDHPDHPLHPTSREEE